MSHAKISAEELLRTRAGVSVSADTCPVVLTGKQMGQLATEAGAKADNGGLSSLAEVLENLALAIFREVDRGKTLSRSDIALAVERLLS